MAAQQGGKGNPASKRMSNPKLKERRASSWRRTEAAKAAGTHRTVKNRARNEVLAAIAAENFGLGQREVRRIRSGKNTNHGLTEAQVALLRIA